MVMERSFVGSIESYLRKAELQDRYAIMKQSRQFAVELDALLETLKGFCLDIASAMEFLESKKVGRCLGYGKLSNYKNFHGFS